MPKKTKTPNKAKTPEVKRHEVTVADLAAHRWTKMPFDRFVAALTEFNENKLTLVEMDVDKYARASVWCTDDGYPELLIITEDANFSCCFQCAR